jgi:hypothetical protein
MMTNLVSVKRLQKKEITTIFPKLCEKEESFVILANRIHEQLDTTTENDHMSLYKLDEKSVISKKNMKDSLADNLRFLNIKNTALAT